MKRHGGAFTLIELLIVVAIIAILAMIAVPNFLEAQTRSKIARVRSDLRTLAVAEEAYFVDWNSYTFGQGGQSGSIAPVYLEGFRCLTTPVAYTTSIPFDVFGQSAIGGTRTPPLFELGVGRAGVGGAGRSFTALENARGMPSDTYEIESDGPDHNDNTGGTGPAPATSGYPWPANTPVADLVNTIYDPTNGTVSGGEIFRVGGVVPPGPALQIFYTLCSGK
jgi:prepilin-type N-terminal cleavage/methylation domain-containing protein